MTDSQTAAPRYAWVMVGLLWPVALLNYLDRQMITTARAGIMRDIPSIETHERFALLMASFMWIYAFLSPVGGYISDLVSKKWTIVLSLLVWSVITFATGFAQTFEQMLVLRGLMGISEAFYIPTALALIAAAHPASSRSRATGLHQTGIYVGMALGGIGGFFSEYSSWRHAFMICGGIGICYAFVLGYALKEQPLSPAQESPKRPALAIVLRTLFRSFSFWMLVLYFTLPAIAGWGVKNWLPSYMEQQFKLSETESGFISKGVVTFAYVVGALLSGIMADRWSRQTLRGRIYTSALGVLLLVPALLTIGSSHVLFLTILGLLGFGIGWGMFDSNNMPILSQFAPESMRATGYGFMNLVSISIGAGATVVMGRMKDQGISFGVAFIICAFIALISIPTVLAIKPTSNR